MEVLVTRRLTLRPPLEVDADDIALHLSNWKVSRMLARAPFPYDHRDAMEWIGRHDKASDRDLVYTVHRERLIGVVSIENREGGPSLGYWLGEDWWGQGFMSEAVSAVLDHYFSGNAEAVVRTSVFADNLASLALQKRTGFSITGSSEAYSTARQAMAPVILTRLAKADFTGVGGVVYDVAA